MRISFCGAVALGALALVGQAAAEPASSAQPRKPAAVSAERFAVKANYTGPEREHGYSAQVRRISNCLATYPGYDWRTDRIPVRPGVTRRCPL